jgi:peptidoglycan/xylan/chitin deacetylase (PgdA/CDA1 family)
MASIVMTAKLRALQSAPLALGYWLGVAGAQQRRFGRARILMFHGTPRAGHLELAMRYLRRHFDVVPLGWLVSALQSPEADLSGKIALTFDDGLRSNVRVAYPLLKKLGLPATFFVCPELINRQRWLWNHEARQRLLAMEPRARERLAAELGAPAQVEGFIGFMKSAQVGYREAVEARIRAASPSFRPSARESDEFELASWAELRALDPGVVTIGSHTLTHPILTSLAEEDAQAEIADSRRMLEDKLQRTVDLFAYPNGEHSPAVHACARRHYRGAVTTAADWAAAGCDPHLIPRASAPPSPLRLAWNLHQAPC